MERALTNDQLLEVGVSVHAARVMARVLAQEEAKREHLVVYLSGAHAYGFPSPDSDLDLKAIHIEKTAELLGFDLPSPTFDRAEIIEDVEIDYTSNELSRALAGIIAGNGNFLERVLGVTPIVASPFLGELRPLVRRALNRKTHHHYRGFARKQLADLEKKPTVKKLLYVFRTATTGLHLLETGELEANLSLIAARYDLVDVPALIERKRAGERTTLELSEIDRYRAEIDRLLARFDAALRTTSLPDASPNVDELRDWLVEVRRTRFA